MTLVELAIVIVVLLTLVTILLIGARGWKKGTDRARCIVNIRQMQLSVRAYASFRGLSPGHDLSQDSPPVTLLGELVGPGNYVPSLPTCPSDGLYFYGGDVVPEFGMLYMTCSLGMSAGHQPENYDDW